MLPLSPARVPALGGAAEPLAEAMLFWVASGAVTLRSGNETIRASAGQAVWMPAGATVSATVTATDVLVPIAGLDLGARLRPAVLDIPDAWEPWLLCAFGSSLGYLEGPLAQATVSELLADTEASEELMPTLPTSAEALAVAHRVLTAPRSFGSVHHEAARVGWSTRTLQRHFEMETGRPIADWVRQARAALAAQHLREGRDLLWVAHEVGYSTASSFTRMFQSVTGVPPGRWRDGMNDSPAPRRLRAHDLPELPASRTWPRINGAHVAVWVARGSAELSIGSRTHRLREGQAMILPAGMRNRLSTPRGSLVLPIGFRSGSTEAIGAPISAATFDSADRARVLGSAIAAYTPLQAHEQHHTWAFDAVVAGSERHWVTEADALLARLASEVARDEEQDRPLAEWARIIGVSEQELRRVLHDHAGMTFAQWLRLSRMTRARAHLHNGAAASTVARRLGYAHLPAFTRAFRAVHGSPPQQHLGREVRVPLVAADWNRQIVERSLAPSRR